MIHSFLLTLTKENARLELWEGEQVKAAKEWQESRDMGRQLFEGIAELLQENGLGPTDVDSFRLETAVSDNFTSVKIAETVAKIFNFAVATQKGQRLR